MGQLRNVVPQKFTMGNTCLGWSRILKLFLERGKEEEVKKTIKARRNAEKNAENNGNKTSRLLKKDQYFGTYHKGGKECKEECRE
jgi:hypothetical protein